MRTHALAVWRAVLLAALVAWAPAAHAAGKGLDDEATVEARKHVERAKVHFKLGEFDEAIGEWKEAYRLKTVPTLLFNIAQAYRLAGNYKQSKFAYENYLRDSPNAANREEVLRQLEQLQQLLGEQDPGAKSPPAAQPQPEPKQVVVERAPPPRPVEQRPVEQRPVEQKPVVVEKAPPPRPALQPQAEQRPVEQPPALGEQTPPEKEPAPIEALGGFPGDKPAQQPEAPRSRVLPLVVSAAAALLAAGAGVTYMMASSGWDEATTFENRRAAIDQKIAAADATYSLSLGLAGAAAVGGVAAGVLFVF